MSESRGLENFVPIRRAEMLELLCQQPGVSPAEQGDLRKLAQMLEATFHFEYHARLERLKADYAPFDPDRDTREVRLKPATSSIAFGAAPQAPPGRRDLQAEQDHLARLFDDFTALLERANFRRLSHDDIQEALNAMSDCGMQVDVDFDVFERLEVFARGDGVTRRTRRHWRDRFRKVEVAIPVYQRLAVIFRLRPHKRLGQETDTRTVYLKLFKDIPREDLEMLLPGSRVKMSVMDQTKVWFPTVSGVLMTIWKGLQMALSMAAAGVYGTATFLGLAGGAVGYGAKSFFGYLRTKEKHQLALTSSLYYRNLDNNAGVLFRLLDEAEEQECREALLAYYFLWRETSPLGWRADALDRRIEQFLAKELQVEVDFEVDDALAKLLRLGLVERSEGGRLQAAPIDAALATLDRTWDGIFDYSSQPKTPKRKAA